MEDRNLEEQLHKFREKWRDEIERSHRNTHISEQIYPQTSQDAGRINSQNNDNNVSLTSNRNDISYLDSNNNNNQESMLQAKFANINLKDSKISEKELIIYKAKSLYLLGTESERNGNWNLAVHYYREAIRLKPDIERWLETEDFIGNQEKENDENNEKCNEVSANLVENFKNYTLDRTCNPLIEGKAVHISVLPTEILVHIFKWVISSEVDMRSLEQISMVCRGFYVCARDPMLWRLACYRVFDELSCQTKKDFDGWREMYITRPHLRFDGLYISKMSYFRPGEKSLDNLYKPYHLVNCYRYLRFYSDGLVLSLTSPAEPPTIIPQFHRHKMNQLSSALSGCYVLTEDQVKVVVNSSSKRRSKADKLQSQLTLTMEFTLSKSRKKYNWYLTWSKFSFQNTNKISRRVDNGDFEIDKSYTPYYFSRVKSYSNSTSSLLSQ